MTSTTTELLAHLRSLPDAVGAYVEAARRAVSAPLEATGALDRGAQRELHGLSWIAASAEAIRQATLWGLALSEAGRLGAGESLALRVGIGEYLEQLTTALPMSQNELFRPREIGVEAEAACLRQDKSASWFLAHGNTPETRRQLVEHVAQGGGIDEGLRDETLDAVREQYRRFSADKILPQAQKWHLQDELIPDAVIAELAELGTFGVCIPEEYGGLGLGKLALCVVTEELSRASFGTGSLGRPS